MAATDLAPPLRHRRELRRYQYGAFVLAGLALALGAVLIPRGDELLLIHVKNRDVDRARAMLADAGRRGVSTAASVVAHNELYLLEGHVDRALVELEAYTAARPADTEAWTRLARLYADAQRLDDQARAVAHVYQRAPSSAVARQLVTLLRWKGDEAGEATVLADLVEAGTATTDEHLRGARLAAAVGRPEAALGILDRLRRREPAAFDYAALELYASVILESEGPSTLAERIEPLPLIHTEPDVRVALANALTSWDRPDAAVALFDEPGGGRPAPARLAMRARVAMNTTEAAATARALVARDAVEPLDREPLAALVDLLLSIGDDDGTTAVLGHPSRPADPQLVGLAIGHMVARGARARAQSLIAHHGDAGLAHSPLLALELALDRGDLASAERWVRAAEAADLTPDQVAVLAQAEQRLGYPERACQRLMELARAGTAPAWALTDLVQLALLTGRADEALAVLGQTPHPDARAAWARLAASTGNVARLEPWLGSPDARDTSPDVLRDVYYLLADAGHAAQAVVAADTLAAVEPTAANALLLGHALLAEGRPRDALVPLRRADASSPDATRAYASALVAALAAGADDVADEARVVLARELWDEERTSGDRAMLVEGLWLAGERAMLVDDLVALAGEDLQRWLPWLVEAAVTANRRDAAVAVVAAGLDAAPSDRREPLVRALLDLDAPDALVLPHLRQLAEDPGDGWVYVYDERLAHGGRTADRVALWSSIGRSATTDAELRRGAAARLVELGAPAEAAAVLEPLVQDAGPDDPDVQQLLALWGPQASERSVAWLVSRVQTRPVDERGAWIDHTVRAGGARQVMAAMPTLPATAPSRLTEAWLAAWEAGGRPAELRDALQQVLLRPAVPASDLRRAGRVALAHEHADLAGDAFTLLVARAPFDLEAMRWLGALAFYEGRTVVARTWLTQYAEHGGDEAEPLFQLGELALVDGDRAGAREWFARAAVALESDAAASPVLRANTLVRLDDRPEAIAAFDAILERDPTLDHVRADYVVALLQWGDYDRVAQVLDARPAAGSAARPEVSGARRLDLLRAQWLVHDGAYGAALEVLDRLATEFPTDADVLLARARFDDERGRTPWATRLYEEAERQAPRRDDIARLIEARAREQAPRAGVESEVRSISQGWDEQWVRASASARVTAETPVATTVERMRLSGGLVRRVDGHLAPVETDLLRFDASVAARTGAATVVGASLFGTSGGLGAGARVSHDDLRGRTDALVEVGRPFWEFLETAADDGRRDRVAVERRWRVRPDTAAWLYGGWHRYRLPSAARTDSVALTGGVAHTVRQARPVLTLQYGLDKEQRIEATVVTTPDGVRFMPIPLASREVHLFGAITRAAIGDGWEIEGTGGYTLDRLGGRGGFFTARLTPPPTARIGFELWADQRLFVLATSQRVFRAGARVRVRWQP